MPIDDLMDRIAGMAVSAHEDLAREVVAEVRGDLSDSFPPSSQPGEHPHKRTGDLIASVGSKTDRSGDEITTTFEATAEYAKYLEGSGRPVLSHLPEEWKDRAPRRIQAAF